MASRSMSMRVEEIGNSECEKEKLCHYSISFKTSLRNPRMLRN